jgi:pyruvate dehydrogenase E2 component (dihydrolipoamide acetyltransferase)
MTATGVIDVAVPDIGDFTDIPVIEILVAPGDTVAIEDPLLTLESDKATMDVPAPVAGKVKQLLVKVGDKVSEGTVVLTLEATEGKPEEESEPPASSSPRAASGAPTEPSERDGAPGPSTGSPAAVGAFPRGQLREPSETHEPSTEREPWPGGDAATAGAPPYASPSVRRIAREQGVKLANLSGTGRKGRITKDDVERFLASPPPPATGLDLAPWPTIDFEKYGPIERRPLSRIQKIAARNLARNWAMIPHVTQNDDADVTELEAFRKQLNEEHARDGVKLTMVGFLVVASVATLKAFPDFNASLDGDELVLKRYYNIGFAADTPQGLVVPVIKNADEKGILDIARELTTLSGKAREGKLGPVDMQGATFTISSLGGIGGTGFTPIINAPEVAILGVSRAAMKPVWNGKEFTPRLIVPLSLSYDHRVIDGAAAARFTVHLAKVLSDLRRALL